MADCDLAIEYDRKDRVYRGGELVRGRVVVRCARDVECHALKLERTWRTAGKGNVDHGPRSAATLFSGVWHGGQTYTYPFHFTAPAAPLSYRGELLRIDHLVEARADVPWAFDPKASEPYFVERGGEGGAIETGPIATAADPEAGVAASLAGTTGFVVVGVLFVAGLIFMPFGLVLWVAAAFVLAKTLPNTLSGAWLGPVNIGMPIVVNPGDAAPVRLAFTPTAEVRYTKVEARLIGLERVTSGSGKNRKTRRHVIYDAPFLIAGKGHAAAGRRAEFTGAVHVPDTAAFSIDATYNKVLWRVVFRVELASWPNWTQTRVLRLLPVTREREAADEHVELERAVAAMERSAPPEAAEPAEASEPPPPPPSRRIVEPLAEPEPIAFEPEPIDAAATADEPTDPIDDDAPPIAPPPSPVTLPPATPASPVSPASPAPSLDLHAAIARLASADRFNGERERLLAELSGAPFGFALTLDKVEWTISMDAAPEYRSGRTAVGRIVAPASAATPDTPIAVRFPESATPQLEAMTKGQTLDVTARVVEWNSLYDRAECEAYVAG